MTAGSAFIYGPEDYFAFVESSDPLPLLATPSALENILRSERDKLDLPDPDRVVWVDCVEARYFMQLSWRDQLCHIGDPDESAQRRSEIQSLDPTKFVVALLLLKAKGDAEGGTAAELERAAWHRIALNPHEGIPVLVGPDFDLEPEARKTSRLRYLGRCSELERKSLANAFSLDFLPEARIGDRERDDPNSPPRRPKPSTGKAKKTTYVRVKTPVYELPMRIPVLKT